MSSRYAGERGPDGKIYFDPTSTRIDEVCDTWIDWKPDTPIEMYMKRHAEDTIRSGKMKLVRTPEDDDYYASVPYTEFVYGS